MLVEVVGVVGVTVVVERVLVFRGTTTTVTTNNNSNNFINLAQCPVLLNLLHNLYNFSPDVVVDWVVVELEEVVVD